MTLDHSDVDGPDEFRFLAGELEHRGILNTPDHVPLPGRRDSVIDPDGRAISYLQWGDGGPEFTFLHGAGLNAHTWDATVQALGRNAVAVDLPGHGDSAWRDDADYSPATNARSLRPLIEQVVDGPGPQVLVGQSLGGLTAAVIAAEDAASADALVIVDITPGLHESGAQSVRDFLQAPEPFRSRDEIVDRAIAFGIGTDRRALERGVWLNTREQPDGTVIFKHHLANLGDRVPLTFELSSVWASFEKLDIPVLLVRASHGFLDDALEREFLDRVPGSRSVRIEAGHNVQEFAPVQLAEAIRDFVDESAPIPGQVPASGTLS